MVYSLYLVGMLPFPASHHQDLLIFFWGEMQRLSEALLPCLSSLEGNSHPILGWNHLSATKLP